MKKSILFLAVAAGLLLAVSTSRLLAADASSKEVTITGKALCAKCEVQSAFTFEGNAGPGFSGGPVLDAADGKLLGIVFGYVDDSPGKRRIMYAYTMDRVLAELDQISRKLPVDRD